MIIVKVPLRISLCGGGTDMVEFYKEHGGAVVSFAINKFIYIMINDKFEKGIRLSYSITENVMKPEELKHDIVREALLYYGIDNIEIASVADIPGGGTGLGSSSAFAVGLILGLNRLTGKPTNRHPCELAEQAYNIERNLCKHPVGKQDHYASAYGGFNYFEFNQDDTVTTIPIRLGIHEYGMMQHRMMLFWVGKTRKADEILQKQADGLKNSPKVIENALSMKKYATMLYELLEKNNIDVIGECLHDSWQLKKQMAEGISNPDIDSYYKAAMMGDAIGGKLLGAGGSGFLLFYADYAEHESVEKALGLRRVYFSICEEGARIVYEEK